MKNTSALVSFALTALLLSGCSGAPEAGSGEGAASSSDTTHPGKTAFMQCAACHSVEASDGNKLGPNLAGIIDRKAGVYEGFAFSEAMVNSDITWTREELDAFLKSPTASAPGTTMIFAGIADEKRRADLIDYLAQSGDGQ
ncbi:MAG: c-type cytochrome [Marinomonas sp.]